MIKNDQQKSVHLQLNIRDGIYVSIVEAVALFCTIGSVKVFQNIGNFKDHWKRKTPVPVLATVSGARYEFEL